MPSNGLFTPRPLACETTWVSICETILIIDLLREEDLLGKGRDESLRNDRHLVLVSLPTAHDDLVLPQL